MKQGQKEPHTTYAIGRPAHAARRSVAVIAGLSAAVGASEFLRPVHLANPGIRAGMELTMTLFAVASAGLMLSGFDRRRVSDLLLLATFVAVALVEAVFAVTALTGTHGAEPSAAIRLGSEALLAIAFAASALAPNGTLRSVGRRTAVLSGAACVATVALTELIGELTPRHGAPGGLIVSGMAAAAAHPVSLAAVLATSAVLGASAITFLRRAAHGDGEARLLAGASILLAAASPYMAFPMLAANWATSGDALRAAAYALLLVVAFRRCVDAKRQVAQSAARAAVETERVRIARDLHDGLAQDLAFIVNQGQRLTSGLGPDSPVSMAARRALEATRGVIVDLSATDAPTTGAALRRVAAQLGERFEVQVDVHITADPGDADAARLPAPEREEVVRIAREAIVNAIRHGRAGHIEVALDCRGGSLLLRVSDDGCGMPEQVPVSSGGFGLPTMHARADSLGGHLTARRAARGGTELEVVVSA
jgi:signal transduction histidine kinase